MLEEKELITEADFSIVKLVKRMKKSEMGAIVSYLGMVRDEDSEIKGMEIRVSKGKAEEEVEPRYKLFDVYLIGVPPILVGVEDDHVIFPYVKPCCGTFVLKMERGEEIERLRSEWSKKP